MTRGWLAREAEAKARVERNTAMLALQVERNSSPSAVAERDRIAKAQAQAEADRLESTDPFVRDVLLGGCPCCGEKILSGAQQSALVRRMLHRLGRDQVLALLDVAPPPVSAMAGDPGAPVAWDLVAGAWREGMAAAGAPISDLVEAAHKRGRGKV